MDRKRFYDKNPPYISIPDFQGVPALSDLLTLDNDRSKARGEKGDS